MYPQEYILTFQGIHFVYQNILTKFMCYEE